MNFYTLDLSTQLLFCPVEDLRDKLLSHLMDGCLTTVNGTLGTDVSEADNMVLLMFNSLLATPYEY